MTVCCLIWIQVNIQNYGFHANRASDMLMLVEMSGRTGGWAIVLSSPSVIPLVFSMLPSTTGYENLSLQRRSESLEAPLSLFCSHLHKSFWISHPPPSAVDYDFCHVTPAAERGWESLVCCLPAGPRRRPSARTGTQRAGRGSRSSSSDDSPSPSTLAHLWRSISTSSTWGILTLIIIILPSLSTDSGRFWKQVFKDAWVRTGTSEAVMDQHNELKDAKMLNKVGETILW